MASNALIEELQRYLYGREWKRSIEMFVDANCTKFADIGAGEFTFDHHNLWKTYQEIVENVLDMALMSVGGSIEAMEKALDEIVHQPAKGPRDAAVKDVIERLMTYSDFDSFALMMKLAAHGNDYHVYSESSKKRDPPKVISTKGGRVSSGLGATNSSSSSSSQSRGSGSHGYGRSQAGTSPAGKNSNPADRVHWGGGGGGGSDPRYSGVVKEYYETLITMGFPADLVEVALANIDEQTTLEELVMNLSGLQSDVGGESKGAGAGADYRGRPYGATSAGATASRNDGGTGMTPRSAVRASASSSNRSQWPHVQYFIEEYSLADSVGELYAKFSMAKSVVETFIEGNNSTEVVQLLQWAGGMCELYTEIGAAFDAERSFKSVQIAGRRGGLLEWYKELEVTRRKIDEDSVAGKMLSDDEMQRMAELDRIAEMGTDDERLLHSLISRNDKLQADIKSLHNRCSALVASGVGIKREALEELYLYLKEKVGSGEDLEVIADEMHERVYSQITSQRGAEVINLLLDMHILEDEQVILRQRIFALCNVSPNRAGGGGGGGPGGGVDTAPAMTFLGLADGDNDSKQSGRGIFDLDDDDSKATALGDDGRKTPRSPRGGESKYGADAKNGGVGAGEDGGEDGSLSARGGGRRGGGRGVLGHGAGGDDNSGDADYLNGMKAKHKDSLQNLKNTLDADKNKKLQELEARLMRRRILRKKELAAAARESKSDDGGGGGSEPDTARQERKELEAAMAAAENEVEAEMKLTTERYRAMEEGLVSGYKKRCIQEAKLAKEKGRALTEEERKECFRTAADAVKSRFERDQKALLDSLEAERTKQKKRMLKQLAAKKTKLGGGATVEELVKLDDEAVEQLKLLNVNFDDQATEALSKPQSDVLLALSAIYMDETMLQPAPPTTQKRSSEEEDEDDYFGEESNNNKTDASMSFAQRARAWLASMETLKDTYVEAGQQLQGRMRLAHGVAERDAGTLAGMLAAIEADETGGDEEGSGSNSSSGSVFSSVSAHMLKVITEAYCSQIGEGIEVPDESAQPKNKGKKGGLTLEVNTQLDMSRVKAGILEEFEKTRSEYEDLMERARLTSKTKLREKRNKMVAKKQEDGSKGEDGDEQDGSQGETTEEIRVSRTNALFEEAVDSFLDDPIVVHKGPATTRPNMLPTPSRKWAPGGGSNATSWGRKVVLDPLPYEQAPAGGPVVGGAANNAAANDHNNSSSTSNNSNSKESPEKRRLKEEEHRQERERERIKAEHTEKEKELIDGLHSQMSLRKHTLQERLRRKRDAREQLQTAAPVGSYAGGGDAGVAAEEEEEMALDDIARLEQAFETVVSLVKSAEGTKLEGLDLEALMSAMERVMRGERLNALIGTDTTDGGGAAGGGNNSGGGSGSAYAAQAQREQGDRVALQQEVKRISNVYNEEKQKLDLMMKIQQARQRQTLQRKLMERKQQQQHAAVGPTLAAQLGGERGGGGGGGGGGEAGSSLGSPKKSQLEMLARAGTQGLASRGLSLGPIMRK